MSKTIHLIDDDALTARQFKTWLEADGWNVRVSGTCVEGVRELRAHGGDAVLLDVHLPDGSGVDLIPDIKAIDAEIPILMISASGETENVVHSIKNGASDYFNKPIVDKTAFVRKVREALELRKMMSAKRELQSTRQILGRSHVVEKLSADISKVSASDASILLRGESGTGKTMIAELIHNLSPRKDGAFISVNCAAIPEGLLESELFGHEKGAFTGAVSSKPGKFELAHGGTLFLDEIGELALPIQAKLLRVLQGGEFERVGGVKTLRSNARVISATNRNLETAVEEKRFREDLYFRLNVLPILIPPLRDRKEDLALLIEHFVGTFSRKAGKKFRSPNGEILRRLEAYAWPGNIRELQNVIERAVILGSEPEFELHDFSVPQNTNREFDSLPVPAPRPVSSASLRDFEYQAFVTALEKSSGNVSKAAKILNTSRGTVYRRMKTYGVACKRPRSTGP